MFTERRLTGKGIGITFVEPQACSSVGRREEGWWQPCNGVGAGDKMAAGEPGMVVHTCHANTRGTGKDQGSGSAWAMSDLVKMFQCVKAYG